MRKELFKYLLLAVLMVSTTHIKSEVTKSEDLGYTASLFTREYNVYPGGKYIGEYTMNNFGPGRERPHGLGFFVLNGDTLVGEYIEGALHRGVISYKNGHTFEGSFHALSGHSVLKGIGTWTYTNPEGVVFKYMGEFRFGYFHGQGLLTTSSGFKSVGQWNNGKKRGKATAEEKMAAKYLKGIHYSWNTDTLRLYSNENDTMLELPGAFWLKCNTFTNDNGFFTGYKHGDTNVGILTSDGNVVVGEFKNGNFYKGVRVTDDGYKYEGIFQNGKLEGVGACTLRNKDGAIEKFIGEFKDGRFNGLGILVGEHVYIGQFSEGQEYGLGVCYDKTSSRQYFGEFNDNYGKKSYGILKNLDGTIYVGEFCNHRTNVIGIEIRPDGTIHEGTFKSILSGN